MLLASVKFCQSPEIGPNFCGPVPRADTIRLYKKANEALSAMKDCKSKESCEKLQRLVALDIRYLLMCDLLARKKMVPDDSPRIEGDSGATGGTVDCLPAGDAKSDDDNSSADGSDQAGDAESPAANTQGPTEGAASQSTDPKRIATEPDPYDFIAWDPFKIDSIPFDTLTYSEGLDFVDKRSYHAAAIFFFYVPALREKFPALNNSIHAGWQAYFKRPMVRSDLDRWRV